MSYTVGIVGKGFVGGAMYENFKDVFNTLVWDTDESKRNVATFREFVNTSDIIFVCVPTPMKESGECDISIVSAVIFVSSLEHAVVDVNIIIKVIKILFRCLLTF